MRSAHEILFRLRQDLRNLAQLVKPPLGPACQPPQWLPDVPALQADPMPVADSVLRGELPLLGVVVPWRSPFDWRRDPVHGTQSPCGYFRTIPYLDFDQVGDHKLIWEANRHQHLVSLAQAFCATGNRAYLESLNEQLESWLHQNPFLRGINWTSALEVAFRALSWIWIDRLAGNSLVGRQRFLQALFHHACYLENNLSIYFSPNTHLLGEALALHAIGCAYPQLAQSERWKHTGASILEQEIIRQVREDGSYFEQSSYYHVYALDFFLLHAAFRHWQVPSEYLQRIHRMAVYLDALLGPGRTLPLIGDDDGGRLFHPYGKREVFGRTTLEWSGLECQTRSSRWFPDSGLAVLERGATQVIFDAGPFGPGSAGHSHSDTLSIIMRTGNREILIDPGTFTYVAGREWRDAFRSSASHNTIRIDGRDQAVPAGPFRWTEPPVTRLLEWRDEGLVSAECRYQGFTHKRTLQLENHHLRIYDEVDGSPGTHLVEQFWRPGPGADVPSRFEFDSQFQVEQEQGWRSLVLCEKHSSPVIRCSYRGALPFRAVTRVAESDDSER